MKTSTKTVVDNIERKNNDNKGRNKGIGLTRFNLRSYSICPPYILVFVPVNPLFFSPKLFAFV